MYSKGKSDSNPPSACAAKQLKALVPQRVALVPETARVVMITRIY